MSCETNARHALTSAAPNGIAPTAARTAHGRGKLQAGLSRYRMKLVVGVGIAAAAGGTYLGLRAGAPYLASRTSALELASLKPVLKRAMQANGFETQDRLLSKLERDLAGVVKTSDLAMKALDRRGTPLARLEFRHAMATKVRARKILKAVQTLKTHGGPTLGAKGFQIGS